MRTDCPEPRYGAFPRDSASGWEECIYAGDDLERCLHRASYESSALPEGSIYVYDLSKTPHEVIAVFGMAWVEAE